MQQRKARLAIKSVYSLIIAFNVVIFLNSIFAKTFIANLDVFNFLFISIILLGTMLYIASSFFMRISASKNKSRRLLAARNIKYSREVIKIIFLASPLMLPIFLITISRLSIFWTFANTGVWAFLAPILCILFLAAAITIGAYVWCIRTIKKMKQIDEKFIQFLNQEYDYEISSEIFFEENSLLIDLNDIFINFIKSSDLVFDINISTNKGIIFNEANRSSNPPIAFVF